MLAKNTNTSITYWLSLTLKEVDLWVEAIKEAEEEIKEEEARSKRQGR